METKFIIKNVAYTPREVDVMSCIIMGICDTKTIALMLALSNSTVEKHIQNIIKKMEVNSRKMILIILQNDKSYSFLKKHYTLLKNKFVIEHNVNLKTNNIIYNSLLEEAVLGFFKLFLLRFFKNTMIDVILKRKSKKFLKKKISLREKIVKIF